MVSLNDVPEPCMEPVSRTTIIKIWVAREGASRARFTRSRRICQVATDDARSRWRLRVLRQLRLWADHPDIGKRCPVADRELLENMMQVDLDGSF